MASSLRPIYSRRWAASGRAGGRTRSLGIRSRLASRSGSARPTAFGKSGFLHDGTLAVFASERLTQVVGGVNDSLALGGQVFAALSQQTLSGAPWLVRASVRKLTRPMCCRPLLGNLTLLTESGLTYYPNGGAENLRS